MIIRNTISENGTLYVLCGQGADGDYDGGDAWTLARYRSRIMGKVSGSMELCLEPAGSGEVELWYRNAPVQSLPAICRLHRGLCLSAISFKKAV